MSKILTGALFVAAVAERLAPASYPQVREGQTPEDAQKSRRKATSETILETYGEGELPVDAEALGGAYRQIAQSPDNGNPKIRSRNETCGHFADLLGERVMTPDERQAVVAYWNKKADDFAVFAEQYNSMRYGAMSDTLLREAQILAAF